MLLRLVPVLALLLAVPAAPAAAGAAAQPLTVTTAPGSVLTQDGGRSLLVQGSTAQPICRVRLERRTGRGAPWVSLGTHAASGTSFAVVDDVSGEAAGKALRYRARVIDCDGTVRSTPLLSPLVGSEVYDSTDPSLALTGPAAVVRSPAAYGGSYRRSTGLGVQVSFRAPADLELALYARTGPSGGLADVYIDDVFVSPTTFYSATPADATRVWAKPPADDGRARHQVRYAMRAAGPGGGTDMTFDAVGTLARAAAH